MKKILLFALLLVGMTSCYNTTVCVGDMKPDDAVVEVNTVKSNHFVYGLVGNKKIEASKYVGGKTSYKVKYYHSFVDGLLDAITWGIYNPTTVTFYAPYDK